MAMLNLEDTAAYLGQSPEEVKKMAERGDIESYNIGGVYLRFKEEHLTAFKQKLDSFPVKSSKVVPDSKSLSDSKSSLVERIQDFWYFNNFYIISLGVIIALVVIILK